MYDTDGITAANRAPKGYFNAIFSHNSSGIGNHEPDDSMDACCICT